MRYERAQPYNFMGIEEPLSSFEDSSALILPVPYDGTTTYISGTRQGPRAIIEASRSLEFYDEEIGEEIVRYGIHTLPEVEPAAEGPRWMVERVAGIVSELSETGKLIVLLGGEHSITIGAVWGLCGRVKELSVLQIDAHADLRDEHQSSKFSHACVMRRVRERCRDVVQVAIRSLSAEEAEFIEREGLRDQVFFMDDISKNPSWIEEVISRLGDAVYITIDLDGLDPSVMPAVGTPEPGGLGWRELLKLLREIAERKRVIGFDVVELSPIPGFAAPNVTAAKLTYKLIGYILSRR